MRDLVFVVYQASAWFLSLGNKFFRVAPLLTGAAVSLTIASQLMLLIGFLLPLKVILLLSSETIPHYFPSFMAAFGRERLIILLSISSVLFYFGHLICDSLVTRFSDQGAELLVQRSRKMTIFERQDEVASKGYLRFSQAFAGICFTAVCLCGMFVFYAKLALLIVSYFVVFLFFSVVICVLNPSFRMSLADGLGSLPKFMAGLGFLMAFSFIVVDYLYFEPAGVLVSVVVLILSRQLFSKSANVLRDVAELFQQQGMLRALYFHAHSFRPERKESDFAGLVRNGAKDKWILESLATVIDTRGIRFSSHWIFLGTPELLCFVTNIEGQDGSAKQILLKVFDPKRRSLAVHEATLLAQQPGLRTPLFLGVTTVAGMNCHLFDVTNYKVVDSDPLRWRALVEEYRTLTLAITPTPALVSSYLRSRPHLAGRLDVQSVNYLLGLYEGQYDQAPLVRFKECLPSVVRVLGSSPLTIQLPDIRPGMLWLDPEGRPCMLHWGRWELEPLGFRWPRNITVLESSLALLKQERPALEELSVHQVRLAALCTDFEDSYRRGQYDKAYRIVSAIISEYAECNRGEV